VRIPSSTAWALGVRPGDIVRIVEFPVPSVGS
jgi:hypothetical protein